MIFVDDCGIGKTYTAEYLSRNLTDCFYIDGSQCKTKSLFVRALARAVGVGERGWLPDLKEKTKDYLRNKARTKPVVIIDEAGDVDYETFLLFKEYMNATPRTCGWYLMGADGLREKIERGRREMRVGYAEIFSRVSENYSKIVPSDKHEKEMFYKKLITDVLSANIARKELIPDVVRQCLTTNATGHIGGLRRAENLAILYSN
jgi:DNA transposition AAA+ family ATPase